MAIFPIRKHGDPVLREKALIVPKVDGEIKALAKNMADTMYDAPGMGLAANQVGILKRVIAYDIGQGLCTYVNPEIVWVSEECDEDEEGCLSFYEIRVPILRPIKVKLRAKNLDNKEVEFEAEDLESRVLQHEIDHLNGIVILDRTSRGEQRKALRRLRDLLTI